MVGPLRGGIITPCQGNAVNKLLSASFCLLALAASAASAADFKPDGDGYIRNWLLLDPIELDEKASDHNEDSQKAFFDKEFFSGQFKSTPAEGQKIKVGASELAWKAGQAEEAAYKLEPKDNSLYLAVTYVTSDKEIPEAVLSIGSDDSSCWRVNGTDVLRVYNGRAVEVDQDKTKPFTLVKGTNVILASVINGGGEVGLSARILDKDGQPVKNVVVSLTPPGK
jgi:hypothetical protein